MNLLRIRDCVWLSLSVVLIVSLAGCGKDGPERYRMSGTVTFEGQPVVSGTISFEPAEKGTGGGYAHIMNGTYDTELDGRGHLGGPHSVQIAGFGEPKESDHPDDDVVAVPMFDPISFTEDLPTESTTRNFELPLNAGP
jgi:hypothetical protein